MLSSDVTTNVRCETRVGFLTKKTEYSFFIDLVCSCAIRDG